MSYLVEMIMDGKPVKKIRHGNETYLPVEAGKEFSLKITNQSDRQIEAVITVDGVDIVDGGVGSYNNRGYLVRPYQSFTVDGWRVDNNTVHKFKVSGDGQKEDSYAAKRGMGGNIGVIGVAIFWEKRAKVKAPQVVKKERPKPWDMPRKYYGSSGISGQSANFCSTVEEPTSANLQSVGTEMGDAKHSHVQEVSFFRVSDFPSCVISLYYDTVPALAKKGVIVENKAQAFPESAPYCPKV